MCSKLKALIRETGDLQGFVCLGVVVPTAVAMTSVSTFF